MPQPARGPADGPVAVTRLGVLPGSEAGGEMIMISATHKGAEDSLVLSTYNAYRIFAMLSLMLEVPISKAAAKQIKL